MLFSLRLQKILRLSDIARDAVNDTGGEEGGVSKDS
jgi:hypothetical protein